MACIKCLTYWGRVTHICVSKLTIIGSENGLSPGRRQAIIWTNTGILLIRTLGTNFSEILSEIRAFSFKKMHVKISSAKGQQFCFGLNALTTLWLVNHQRCLNNPICLNLGLCAACWTHFMCHHELWPTSVSHPFSSFNSFLGFDGGKHYQKIINPIFRLVLQNFAIPGCFPYILFYLFSLLSSGW